MPQSVTETRAHGRGTRAGPLAGAVLVAALATLYACGGDTTSSWVQSGAGLDAPTTAPQTRIEALRPARHPQQQALPCNDAADCAEGSCTLWFEDADGDGFGNPDTGRGYCGGRAPTSNRPLVPNGQDCCDLNDRVRPTQTEAFASPIREACPLARGYDYDCDGVIRYGDDMGASSWAGACDATTNASNDPNMPCVERAGVFLGPGNALQLSLESLVTAEGDAALCGNRSVEWKSCSLAGSACQGQPSSAPPCN